MSGNSYSMERVTTTLMNVRKIRPKPKRLDSTSDRLFQSIFDHPRVVTSIELDYLAAAEAGDLSEVKKAVLDYNVNINCIDHMGRSAIELAVTSGNMVVVEFLLPRANIQSVEDALMFAIEKENVKLVELILSHPLYKSTKIKLGGMDTFFQRDDDSPRSRPGTTPIVLAAQKDNFYLVQLLIQRGAVIGKPHDYFCDCVECSNQRVFDSVKYSKGRLNTYQALVSSAYISLSSEDPILTAFHLSHELERLADIEKEYKVIFPPLFAII